MLTKNKKIVLYLKMCNYAILVLGGKRLVRIRKTRCT